MMTRIGRERGWPPMTRPQFDQLRSARGALVVGSPQEVAGKILAQHELFRHDRFLAQMSVGMLPHTQAMRSIELLGAEVAPLVREAIAAAPRPTWPDCRRADDRVGRSAQLGAWAFLGAPGVCFSTAMPQRQILLLALVVSALVPASAAAAPAVTVTGDAGSPIPLNATAATGIRNMDVVADVTVPQAEARYYTTQVIDQAGSAASSVSSCRETRFGPTSKNFADYRGNGTYTVLVRYFGTADSDCNALPTRETRFQYAINAGIGVTGPPGRLLTRAPNSFSTTAHQLGVSLNPGAFSYEVRYALGGVAGPDGAISGPSAETFVDRASGLASFRFDKPGRYLIVARAKTDDFFTPWSAPVNVNAIAPFDIERVTFPDSRGPRYKLRGQVRERVARGRVTISWARGRKGGKFHRIGRAKINSKGRFTKKFRLRKTGVYRLRYTYRGSSLVAAGRVTEPIRIRRRIFFG